MGGSPGPIAKPAKGACGAVTPHGGGRSIMATENGGIRAWLARNAKRKTFYLAILLGLYLIFKFMDSIRQRTLYAFIDAAVPLALIYLAFFFFEKKEFRKAVIAAVVLLAYQICQFEPWIWMEESELWSRANDRIIPLWLYRISGLAASILLLMYTVRAPSKPGKGYYAVAVVFFLASFVYSIGGISQGHLLYLLDVALPHFAYVIGYMPIHAQPGAE